jgi:hypothetical protein
MNKDRSIRLAGSSADSSPRRLANARRQPTNFPDEADFKGSTETFSALVTLEQLQAKLAGGVALTIGEGTQAVTTRFGSDTVIDGPTVRAFIDAARNALQNETADVVLRLEELKFLSGHDLETFAEKQRIDIASGDVEQ